MATYSAPNSSTNAEVGDDCFQFCTTDSPENVSACLAEKLGAYEKGLAMFECFNVGSGRKGNGYSSEGARLSAGYGVGWAVGGMLGLWAVRVVASVV